jgi:DNA invertase Pin-like site-specific DNA recombinase
MIANQLVPAAQYLRMSTEHQQYSLASQSTAIQTYAEFHGFEVVRTYSDPAKSGLVLRYRTGLRQLQRDVVSGSPDYRVILVYDVSLWGPFQDTDESAHYEFLCKSSWVPVHYCAETFANDGSLTILIMKALKRSMAGEYSRELGVEVLAGLKRQAHLGFKQGGYARLRSATGAGLSCWRSETSMGLGRAKKDSHRSCHPRPRSRPRGAMRQGHLPDARMRKANCLCHCS